MYCLTFHLKFSPENFLLKLGVSSSPFPQDSRAITTREPTRKLWVTVYTRVVDCRARFCRFFFLANKLSTVPGLSVEISVSLCDIVIV